jgi:hypothetical protein
MLFAFVGVESPNVSSRRNNDMAKTLSIGIKRGFPEDRLKRIKEPKVRMDLGGYYLQTVTEGVKVYFEDFYSFLERAEKRCAEELRDVKDRKAKCDPQHE